MSYPVHSRNETFSKRKEFTTSGANFYLLLERRAIEKGGKHEKYSLSIHIPIHLKINFQAAVVQSMVSLMSLLRGQLVKCFTSL